MFFHNISNETAGRTVSIRSGNSNLFIPSLVDDDPASTSQDKCVTRVSCSSFGAIIAFIRNSKSTLIA